MGNRIYNYIMYLRNYRVIYRGLYFSLGDCITSEGKREREWGRDGRHSARLSVPVEGARKILAIKEKHAVLSSASNVGRALAAADRVSYVIMQIFMAFRITSISRKRGMRTRIKKRVRVSPPSSRDLLTACLLSLALCVPFKVLK